MLLRVGIDWGLDAYSISNGQYRYAVDLMQSLARLEDEAQYTVFGTKVSPPPEIAALFAGRGGRWVWSRRPQWQGRGKRFVDHALRAVFLRGRRLDVLHCIDTPIPRFAPCPVLWTLYDLMPEVMPEERAWRETRDWKRYRHAAQRRVTRHLAISATTANDAVRLWNLEPERVTVTHLGTTFPPPAFDDVVPGSLLTRLSIGEGPFACAAYNLYPRKNMDALLEAMRLLHGEFPTLRLALFGRTGVTREREEWFDRTIEESGLADAVVRCGFVDDLELADIYRSAVAFVFPSLYEGFGLPLLEAMSVGACVVARNASSMAEVVGDGGLLLETKDARVLAEGIARLVRDPSARRRFADRGRARASHFSLQRLARETFDAYLEATKVAPRFPRR